PGGSPLLGGDAEHVQDPLDGIAGGGGALVDLEAPGVVLDHQVGERASGVDGEPHGGGGPINAPGLTLTARRLFFIIRAGARIAKGRSLLHSRYLTDRPPRA